MLGCLLRFRQTKPKEEPPRPLRRPNLLLQRSWNAERLAAGFFRLSRERLQSTGWQPVLRQPAKIAAAMAMAIATARPNLPFFEQQAVLEATGSTTANCKGCAVG
jgi:hypothetical protein